MIFSYSLSLPLESFHLLNITDASTLAGLYVLGSFSKLTTESKMVLKKKNIEKLTFWTKFENPENLDRYSKQNSTIRQAWRFGQKWIFRGWDKIRQSGQKQKSGQIRQFGIKLDKFENWIKLDNPDKNDV